MDYKNVYDEYIILFIEPDDVGFNLRIILNFNK